MIKLVICNDRGVPVRTVQGVYPENENFIAVNDTLNVFDYWHNGQGLVQRPTITLTANKTRVLNDGKDQITISGLPSDYREWGIKSNVFTSTVAVEIYLSLNGKYKSNLIQIISNTLEYFQSEIRVERDKLLKVSDWTAMNDNGLSSTQRDAWMKYRQALRDITATQPKATLDTVIWPVAPDGTSGTNTSNGINIALKVN